MQRLERDRLARLRHHGGEDAVADDRIGQHETGGIEKAGEALIELVELARGDGEAAMMQKLGIALEPQAACCRSPRSRRASPVATKPSRVGRQRLRRRATRHERPAQQELAVSPSRPVPSFVSTNTASSSSSRSILPSGREARPGARLAAQHHAREIAERIEIEQQRRRAVEAAAARPASSGIDHTAPSRRKRHYGWRSTPSLASSARIGEGSAVTVAPRVEQLLRRRRR